MIREVEKRTRAVLRKLGKRLKIDMIYIVRGGSYLGISQIISSGSTFVSSIALANLLLPETLGIYKYILSVFNILAITTLTGMDSAVVRSVSRGFDGTAVAGFRAKLHFGLLGSLGALVLASYYLIEGNHVFAIAFGICAIFVPLFESFDIYNSFLFAKSRFDKQSVYNIIRKLIAVVALLATIFLTQNIYIILSVYFLSLVLPAIVYYYRTIKLYKKNNRVEDGAIAYGKHLSANGVFTLIITEIDRILVFHYLGAVSLATYSLALAPVDQIKGLLKNINQMALPRFAKYDIDDIRSHMWPKIRILLATSAVLTTIYILLTPIFYGLFFPKYPDAIALSMVFAVSVVPAILAGFFYTVLESQKAEKQIYIFNFSSNIISLAILFPAIFYWGLWGAVVARLISRSVTLIITFVLVQKTR